MSAKVKRWKDAWWVITHHAGSRSTRRIGPTKADKRRAEKVAEKVNGAIALGTFTTEKPKATSALPCSTELKRWHDTYAPTMKPSYKKLTLGLIDHHLAPHFGDRDMREIRESDILEFIQRMQDKGRAPGTIQNALSALRRAFSVLVKDGRLSTNPVAGMGKLMAQVRRVATEETPEVQAWSASEVQKLLAVAREKEPRFAPLLQTLLSTGMRRGEALGLKWTDVGFDTSELSVRRAITATGLSTPKSGKARRVKIPPSLAEALFDLLAVRRRECLGKGWPEVPEWVFCSDVGTAWDPRNVARAWNRVRRHAQKQGVRPLRLHDARHTYATSALRAGKSVRWVADQLGHANPSLTLQVYAHALREEEVDLSFADFGVTGRHYTAPADSASSEAESPDSATDCQGFRNLERETGIEPATLSLGS